MKEGGVRLGSTSLPNLSTWSRENWFQSFSVKVYTGGWGSTMAGFM